MTAHFHIKFGCSPNVEKCQKTLTSYSSSTNQDWGLLEKIARKVPVFRRQPIVVPPWRLTRILQTKICDLMYCGRIRVGRTLGTVINASLFVTKCIFFRCKQNCAAKMNPSSRLSVLAKCSEGCFGELIYSWEVYQNEGGKKSKLWQRRDNITATNSVQNPNGPAFALPRDILDGDEEYLIRVFGGRENGAKGRSEYTSLTNDPPRGGACSGKPPVGEALVSDFVLSCSGWRDADMPLTYEFNHKNEEGKLVLLSFGENSHVTVKLPLGNPQQNFSLEIHVKILDYYKGESSVVFTVQVLENL